MAVLTLLLFFFLCLFVPALQKDCVSSSCGIPLIPGVYQSWDLGGATATAATRMNDLYKFVRKPAGLRL